MSDKAREILIQNTKQRSQYVEGMKNIFIDLDEAEAAFNTYMNEVIAIYEQAIYDAIAIYRGKGEMADFVNGDDLGRVNSQIAAKLRDS